MSNSPSPPTPATAAKPGSSNADRDWEIIAVDSKVTESNSTWWKYAWTLTRRNNGSTVHGFDATIEFQDKDGFIIDTSRSWPIVVAPNGEETSTAYALTRTPAASNVARTLAKVAVVR